jgi:asparagine synthase (glutamine-hydrolysing)
MCGIVGILRNSRAIEESELTVMRERLVHRGPDDAGLWIHPEGRVGLAHRRLSIIDLSEAGHQPMQSRDGNLVLVYNGEIYNFQELRTELEEKGYCFDSRTDTEVILHAYQEWGVEAIRRFNGMFAFALYDRRTEQLLLARDRFGEKPLYYCQRDGCFLFASELKALTAHLNFVPTLVPEVLPLYLIFGYIPYPHTIFEHTAKLPPAHYMLVDIPSQECRLESYWEPLTLLGVGDRGEGIEQVVDRLDELLREAVRRRLVADVPVGAFLSGGVDSSLIVSIMADMKSDLKTFSIGFWDEEYDEAPYAKEIARHLGCDHYEHYITPKEALDALVALPEIYDEPFADSSAIPTYLVSRFSQSEVKVVLTGDAGDELFGGYTTYQRLALFAPLLKLPAQGRELVARVLQIGGRGRLQRHSALLQQSEAWELFLYLNERAVTKQPDVARIFLGNDCGLLRQSSFAMAFREAENRGLVQGAMYSDMKSYMVDDNLAKVDRASMAVSLEARVPFLDNQVAEFALGLSANTKMGVWKQARKQLLRRLLGRYLPRELFERPKRGFSMPMASWLRKELRWLVEEYLDAGRLRREGLFDVEFVGGLVREHLSGRRDREAVLWALIFWEMWREKQGV